MDVRVMKRVKRNNQEKTSRIKRWQLKKEKVKELSKKDFTRVKVGGKRKCQRIIEWDD